MKLCKICKRTEKQLEDVELRQIGNPKIPEYICDDCLFKGRILQ